MGTSIHYSLELVVKKNKVYSSLLSHSFNYPKAVKKKCLFWIIWTTLICKSFIVCFINKTFGLQVLILKKFYLADPHASGLLYKNHRNCHIEKYLSGLYLCLCLYADYPKSFMLLNCCLTTKT